MIKAENQTKIQNKREKVNKRHDKRWISYPSFIISGEKCAYTRKLEGKLEYNKDLEKKKKRSMVENKKVVAFYK